MIRHEARSRSETESEAAATESEANTVAVDKMRVNPLCA